MYSDEKEVSSHPVITPSPRRSIHSTMVSYGLKNNEDDTAPCNSQRSPGEDQVDNVMSKMRRPIISKTIKHKHQLKRANSHSSDLQVTEEESSCEDSGSQEDEDISRDLGTSTHTENNSYHRSNSTSESHQFSTTSNNSFRHDSSDREKGSGNTLILICIGIAVVAALWYLCMDPESAHIHKSTQTENSDDVLFKSKIDNIKEKYNVDDDSILKIKTGISTIFSRMDAGSFVFVYNSKAENFDPGRFDKFINEVAFTAAKYLRNNISPAQHTVVLSSSLNMREHGELINRYRDEVSRSGVLLVKELGALPSELAMAFHYYCDEYDPVVKRSAVLFTLNAANCSNGDSEKTTHDFVEKCLAKKWKTVPLENMRPLLTRIVDILIDVTRVF